MITPLGDSTRTGTASARRAGLLCPRIPAEVLAVPKPSDLCQLETLMAGAAGQVKRRKADISLSMPYMVRRNALA
jgi:hypothetical protein